MRRDIQLLRGIAVLFVVIYHADVGIIKNGFLGVDVFFVISGYLITKMILSDLNEGKFSFKIFYLKRARRLLPALYTTLLLTLFIGYYLLTPSDWKNFSYQILGSIGFISNLILPTQIGYFAAEAESTLLLHTWSLSLEEQYYFLLPLILYLTPKNWRHINIIILSLVSFIWCMFWVTSNESPPLLWRFSSNTSAEWAFFLFPTRAWELGIGSIAAYISLTKPHVHISQKLQWISLIAIIAISNYSIDPTHPRLNSILITCATAIIILGNDQWLNNIKFTKPIEKIGDWSYSIYLTHWPIFSGLYIASLGAIPSEIKIFMPAIAILTGYIQYKYIEVPTRQLSVNSFKLPLHLLAYSLLLVLTPAIILFSQKYNLINDDEITKERYVNFGLDANCEGSFNDGILKPECKTSDTPTLAIWGDSFAMHLVPGLNIKNTDLVQLTMSSCGPFHNLAPINSDYNAEWAKSCIEHNNNSLKYISNTKSITHVILSSSLDIYYRVRPPELMHHKKITEYDVNTVDDAFIQTINYLKSKNITPILITPPPRTGVDIGLCLERLKRNTLYFKNNCNLRKSDYLTHELNNNSAINRISQKTNIEVFDLSGILCDKNECRTMIDGTPIYRDKGHLSINGSKILLQNKIFTEPN